MDDKQGNNQREPTSRLAEAIAGQDINGLKEMIMEQMGIDNQDDLIDKVLDILDEDEENDMDKDDDQVIELYQKQEQKKQDNRFDPLDMLVNNKDLILNMLKNSLLSADPEDDNRVQLLYALKPFCNEKRQDRIDKAVQMMSLTKYFERTHNKE